MNRKPLGSLERPPTLHRSVQDAIKAYIVDNDLQAGDVLPTENQLSQQLGISRSLLREAIRGLEALGIVDIRRGSGLYVRAFSFEPLLENLQYSLLADLRELRELLEIRRALETSFLELAIQVISTEQLEALQHILAQMYEKAQNGQVPIDEDRAFHACLYKGLENQTLLKMLDTFWLSFHNASDSSDLWYADPMQTYQLHVPLVDAVKDGAIEDAHRALDRHYQDIDTRLRDMDIAISNNKQNKADKIEKES